MVRRIRLQVVLVVLSIAFTSAWAAMPEGAFRGFVSFSQPNGEYEFPIYDQTVTFEADSATGIALYFEYRAGKLIGIESGLNYTNYDVKGSTAFASESLGDTSALTFPFALNFHFGGKGLDFYVGPFAQFTLWGNLTGPYGEAESDPDFGLGAQVGLDLPIGKSGFMFNVAARYMQLEVGDSSMKVPIDPLLLDVGFGYRW